MQQIVISIMDFLSQHTHDSAPPSVSEEKHEFSPSVESPKPAEEEDAPLASQDEDAQSVSVQRYLHTDTPVPEEEKAEEAEKAEATEQVTEVEKKAEATEQVTEEVEKKAEATEQVTEEEKKAEEADTPEAEKEEVTTEETEKDARFLLTLAPDAPAFADADATQVAFARALHD